MQAANGTQDFDSLVLNYLTSRYNMIGSGMPGPRNLERDCGYPDDPVPLDLYQGLYDRDPVAARIVEVYPKESWQVFPAVFEESSEAVSTAFEGAWRDVCSSMDGERNYVVDDVSSGLMDDLVRLDVLSGIGQFGIALLGIDDGRDLAEPADMKPGARAKRQLLYISTFPQHMVGVGRWVTDRADPRFGMPEVYSITLADAVTSQEVNADVHWTRAIHVVDNPTTSRTLGMPRMQQVLNRILDLRKLYGASAEGFWQGSFPGLAFKTNPNSPQSTKVDVDGLSRMMSDYMMGMRRWIATRNLDLQTISPSVSDPGSHIGQQIDAICIKLGIPKRIFLGSERGELASSQDDDAWNDRLKQHQATHNTRRVVRPIVNRLIALGVLPEPRQVRVVWPDLTSMSEEQRATVASARMATVVAFAPLIDTGALSRVDFWTRVYGLTQADAESVIANAEAEKGKAAEAQQAQDSAAAQVAGGGVTDDHVAAVDDWLAANFNPFHGAGGKFASAAGSVGTGAWRALRAAGAKASHLEHVAKAYALDKVGAAYARLPSWAQPIAVGAFGVTKVGAKVAFATWTASQAFAERIAGERGYTHEQAKQLRGTLSAIDIATFKPISIALHFSGLHAAGLTLASLVPPATAAYLGYSAVRHPAAVYRAAKGAVRAAMARVHLASNVAVHPDAESVADALEAHQFDDWYFALLCAALEVSDGVAEAVALADAAYAEPEPEIVSQDDDAEAVLGIPRTETVANAFCKTGKGGGRDPSCGKGKKGTGGGGGGKPALGPAFSGKGGGARGKSILGPAFSPKRVAEAQATVKAAAHWLQNGKGGKPPFERAELAKAQATVKAVADAHTKGPKAPPVAVVATAKDAEAHLKTLGIHADFKGNLSAAHDAIAGVEKLKALGFKREHMPDRIVASDKLMQGVFRREDLDGLAAGYKPGTRDIMMREGLDFKAFAKRNVDKGWIESGHPGSSLIHETGHMLHFQRNPSVFRKGERSFSAEEKSTLEKAGIAKYGLTNKLEFVAEVFTGLTGGKKYHPDAMRLYKQYGGPPLP